MATQARITTTEAFDSLRAGLIVFATKAHRCIDDATDEARRTRAWLQHDQRLNWEGELRRRSKLLDQAQQELRAAQFTGARDSALMVRKAAVARAEESVAEAERKLKRVKEWNQKYDNNADPILKRLEGIRQYLDVELPRAMAYLRNAQTLIERYADAAPLSNKTPEAAAPETEAK